MASPNGDEARCVRYVCLFVQAFENGYDFWVLEEVAMGFEV